MGSVGAATRLEQRRRTYLRVGCMHVWPNGLILPQAAGLPCLAAWPATSDTKYYSRRNASLAVQSLSRQPATACQGPLPPLPPYLTTLQSPSLQLLNGRGRKKSKCFEMVVVRIISFASKERDDDRGSGWDGIEMPGLKSCTLIKLQPGLCWSMTVMINIKLGIAA